MNTPQKLNSFGRWGGVRIILKLSLKNNKY